MANLMETTAKAEALYRKQLQRSLDASGKEPATPTGWQILALIFDVLNWPKSEGNPAEGWAIKGFERTPEFSVVSIGDGYSVYEISLTWAHSQELHTDPYLESLALHFRLLLREFKLLASTIDTPANPPVLLSKDQRQALIWMPRRKVYTSNETNAEMSLEGMRRFAKSCEGQTVISWI